MIFVPKLPTRALSSGNRCVNNSTLAPFSMSIVPTMLSLVSSRTTMLMG